MKRFKKAVFLTFLGMFLILPFFVLSANEYCPTEGLVPCGTEGCPCTFCHFFVMFDRIIEYLLFEIVPILATLMLAIGGFMYILAYAGKGGPDTLSQAKTLFKSVIIGLILVYAAWLIVNTFLGVIGVREWTGLKDGWSEIECDSGSEEGAAIPRNKQGCNQKAGYAWANPRGRNGFCSKINDLTCSECHMEEECCKRLGAKCDWKSDNWGTRICQNSDLDEEQENNDNVVKLLYNGENLAKDIPPTPDGKCNAGNKLNFLNARCSGEVDDSFCIAVSTPEECLSQGECKQGSRIDYSKYTKRPNTQNRYRVDTFSWFCGEDGTAYFNYGGSKTEQVE